MKQVPLGKDMPILLIIKVSKLYVYIITYVTPGVEDRSTQILTLRSLWYHVSTPFMTYGNTSTHIVTFVEQSPNYIHYIKVK